MGGGHSRDDWEAREREARQQEEAERQRVEEQRRLAEEQERRAQEERERAAEAARRAEEEMRRAEDARRQAEEQARRAEEARRIAEQEMRRIEEERRRAEEEVRQADEQRRRAEEERRRADEERRAAEEQRRIAEENARRVEEERARAEAAQRRAEEDARRVEEERRAIEEQRRVVEEEKRRADEATRIAEEQQRKAEEERKKQEEERLKADEEARISRLHQEQAEQAKAKADKEAADALEARQEAEKALKEGIKPIIVPTQEEINATKRRLQYQDGMFHFAIAGISGSGKSSLINALRGLRNNSNDPRVARTGIVETTSDITRYADTNATSSIVWYDVPGAGTLEIPDWVYFNSQGLYIFDCIIVLTDNRFTDTDVAILRNCARFNIPAYVVRSKSQQHTQNLCDDLEEDEEKDDTERLVEARKKLIKETHENIAQNLERVQMPPQRVYVVDKDVMVQVVNGKPPKDLFDELDLLRDLLAEAHVR